MSKIYAVGDVQGCAPSLKALLKKLPKKSKMIFLGDLVNRGPDSLDVLRWAMRYGRNEQMYSQRPEFTTIVKPLLAGTSKWVPVAYSLAAVVPSRVTLQWPATISMRSAAAVLK